VAIIEIRNLAKTYGAVKAVDDISLDIEPGEFITLLGPSGSGKTTVLRMIAGFEDPDGGTIHLNGTEAAQASVIGGGLPNLTRKLAASFSRFSIIEEYQSCSHPSH